MLLFEGGHDGHHRFDKARAFRTLGAKAPFAPEDPGADRALGRVIGRFDPGMAHERPQGLPPFEEVPTGPFGCRGATRLTRFQQAFYLASDRPHRAGNARVGERAIADPMPPVKHVAGLCPQGVAHRSGTSIALAPGFAIAQQMGPAELSSPARIPAVGAPAIRHQIPPATLTQQLLGPLAIARQPYDKDGDVRGDRGPQPRAVPPFTPSRFVEGRRRLPWHSGPCLRHRLGQGMDGRLLQVGERPQTHREAKQVLQHALRRAFRPLVGPCAQSGAGWHPGTEGPHGHSHRQLAPRRLPAGWAAQLVQLVLRDDRFDRWDLRHLMPLGLRILALQRVAAAAAPLGLDRDHDLDLLNRHQRPCLALVAGLPAGPPAAEVATGPFRGRLRRIARRRPGGGARVLLPPLSQVLNRRFQTRTAASNAVTRASSASMSSWPAAGMCCHSSDGKGRSAFIGRDRTQHGHLLARLSSFDHVNAYEILY